MPVTATLVSSSFRTVSSCSRRAMLPLLAALPFAVAQVACASQPADKPARPAPKPAPAPPRPAGGDVVSMFEPREFRRGARALRYRLLRPEKVEPGKTYPLVLFLHGVGERGVDNYAQIRNGAERLAAPALRAKHPCFAVVPQCPRHSFWGLVSEKSVAAGKVEPDALNLALLLTDELLEQLPVDRRRVYLAGVSMGGMAVFRALVARPAFFAAAVPVCGDGNAELAPRYAKTPVWIFHGEADTVVRPEGSKRICAALQKAGGKARLTLLPGVGHNVWVQAFGQAETWDWLFAQRR